MKDFTRNQSLLLLILVLAIGLAARLYKINDHGIWVDEKTSISSASGIKDFHPIYNKMVFDHIPDDELKVNDAILNKHPFTSADYWQKNTLHNVKNAIILDNSNSLSYAVALHYWIDAFGASDVSGRLFSTLFGILTLVLAFFFGRSFLGSNKYSLALALLLAINCWLILDCQLVRTYAFTAFFAFLSCVIFFHIVFRHKGGWLYPLYAFAAIMALGGHHMTLYIFAAHALIALLFVRDRNTWIKLVITAVPVLLVYGLWVLKFGAAGMEVLKWKNVVLAERAIAHPESKFPGPGTPKNIFGGVINYLNMIMGTHFLFFGLRIFMVMGMLLIPFGLTGIIFIKTADRHLRQIIISLLIIIVAAPLFSAFMSFRSHNAVPFTIFYAAYVVPLGAFLFILCVSRIHLLTGALKTVAITLASLQVIFIVASFTTVYTEVLVNGKTPNPYEHIARQEKELYQTGDVVLYPNWDDAQLTNLYLKGRNDIMQDVDSSLIDKVVLQQANGKQTRLFDFEGGKYRY